jgi:hypothetical protein
LSARIKRISSAYIYLKKAPENYCKKIKKAVGLQGFIYSETSFRDPNRGFKEKSTAKINL